MNNKFSPYELMRALVWLDRQAEHGGGLKVYQYVFGPGIGRRIWDMDAPVFQAIDDFYRNQPEAFDDAAGRLINLWRSEILV